MQNIMKYLWVVLVFSGIDEIPDLIGLQLLWDETKLLRSLGCSFLSAQRFILAQVQGGAQHSASREHLESQDWGEGTSCISPQCRNAKFCSWNNQ